MQNLLVLTFLPKKLY